jgi:enoyl-[acyl-carrier protein] reductase II
VGSRFVASDEASSHINFKETVIHAKEGDTQLSLKKLTPVRMIKNKFFEQVQAAENSGASGEELQNLLGHGRAKKGMFEGKLDEGELEIGQVSTLVKEIKPAAEILKEIWADFQSALQNPLK